MFQPWVESLNFEFKFSVKNTTSVLRFVWFCCCSATVPECSAVPSVFCVPFFRVPAFLVSRYADHYDVVKCCRNLNFEKMDTAPCTGKNDGFWLLWGICKEYIKQNIIKAVLRKANAHPSVICKLIKNQ